MNCRSYCCKCCVVFLLVAAPASRGLCVAEWAFPVSADSSLAVVSAENCCRVLLVSSADTCGTMLLRVENEAACAASYDPATRVLLLESWGNAPESPPRLRGIDTDGTVRYNIAARYDTDEAEARALPGTGVFCYVDMLGLVSEVLYDMSTGEACGRISPLLAEDDRLAVAGLPTGEVLVLQPAGNDVLAAKVSIGEGRYDWLVRLHGVTLLDNLPKWGCAAVGQSVYIVAGQQDSALSTCIALNSSTGAVTQSVVLGEGQWGVYHAPGLDSLILISTHGQIQRREASALHLLSDRTLPGVRIMRLPLGIQNGSAEGTVLASCIADYSGAIQYVTLTSHFSKDASWTRVAKRTIMRVGQKEILLGCDWE